MKTRISLLTIFLLLCFLVGCAITDPAVKPPVPQDTVSSEPEEAPTAPVDESIPPLTLRIVDGAGTDTLLLAERDEGRAGVYTLHTASLPSGVLSEGTLKNGHLIRVHYGSFTEGWPMSFGGVSAIEVVDGGFDDRASLYLQVLEDLWEKDSGLNGGVEVIGVDLSQTSLTSAEQSAVALAFTNRPGTSLLEGSLETLIEQGYITGEPLGTEDAPSDAKFYHWENGCHFSITEQPMEGTYSLVPVTFDAQKWRSSLGAYFFCDCTSVQSALGKWSDYTIGSEMIS